MPLPIKLISTDFDGTLHAEFEDPPLPDDLQAMIAENNEDADAIQAFLESYCAQIQGLTLVRNDIYARFSHAGYNKGTALGEIARQLGVPRDETFAAGDHLNDLPMLAGEFARCI